MPGQPGDRRDGRWIRPRHLPVRSSRSVRGQMRGPTIGRGLPEMVPFRQLVEVKSTSAHVESNWEHNKSRRGNATDIPPGRPGAGAERSGVIHSAPSRHRASRSWTASPPSTSTRCPRPKSPSGPRWTVPPWSAARRSRRWPRTSFDATPPGAETAVCPRFTKVGSAGKVAVQQGIHVHVAALLTNGLPAV